MSANTPDFAILGVAVLAAKTNGWVLSPDMPADETDDMNRIETTVFELAGPDRPGLLAEVTHLLTHNGCNVRSAAVSADTAQFKTSCIILARSSTTHPLPASLPAGVDIPGARRLCAVDHREGVARGGRHQAAAAAPAGAGHHDAAPGSQRQQRRAGGHGRRRIGARLCWRDCKHPKSAKAAWYMLGGGSLLILQRLLCCSA